MGKFIKFEKMITPIFIQLFFWLVFFALIIGGIGSVVYGFMAESGGFLMMVSGAAALLLGPLVLRIYCELLIVLFKIQGSLIEIRDSHNKVSSPSTITARTQPTPTVASPAATSTTQMPEPTPPPTKPKT